MAAGNKFVEESGYSNRFALALAAVRIGAVVVMTVAAMLVPSLATPGDQLDGAAYPGSTPYFPAQYVNQGGASEPMPATF